MIKKIIRIFASVCILAIALIAYRVSMSRTMILPLPYTFVEATKNKEAAQNSNILFMGDRFGVGLGPYLGQISKKASSQLRNDLEIYNWSEKNEGIHRTLNKIKSLEKLPPLIIYAGATEEFFEKKFKIKDKEAIESNFKKYENDKLISIIMTIPFLSRFIYSPLELIEFKSNPVENTTNYPSQFAQKYMELNYTLFKHEFLEFITYIKNKGSRLIVIAPALNLDLPPRLVCDNANTENLVEEVSRINLLIKDKQFKNAYGQLRTLSKVAIGNADVFYALGQAAKGIGAFKKARQALYKAAIFDCAPWRGNMIFNKIMITNTEEIDLRVIDFNRMVNSNYGRDALFIEDHFPQEVYYQKLIYAILEEIKSALKL